MKKICQNVCGRPATKAGRKRSWMMCVRLNATPDRQNEDGRMMMEDERKRKKIKKKQKKIEKENARVKS